MNKTQLKQLIIDLLNLVRLQSVEAVDLLMLTAAQESRLGEYIVQLGGGPALGIFQMEPATLKDLRESYLKYKPELSAKLDLVTAKDISDELNLRSNLAFQVVSARLQYLRFPKKIPVQEHPSDAVYIKDLAMYWKLYWNTSKGKGTVEEAIHNYRNYA